MQNEKKLTRPQQELENALQSLQPAPVNIERDRLMYLTGQMAARRRQLFWPAIAALLAVALTAALVYRQPAPGPQTIDRVVYVQVEKPAPALTAAAGAAIELTPADSEQWRRQADYFKLRDKILDEGVDALPEPPIATGRGQDELIEELRQIRNFGFKRIFNGDS
jgi:hypothetical protein